MFEVAATARLSSPSFMSQDKYKVQLTAGVVGEAFALAGGGVVW